MKFEKLSFPEIANNKIIKIHYHYSQIYVLQKLKNVNKTYLYITIFLPEVLIPE